MLKSWLVTITKFSNVIKQIGLPLRGRPISLMTRMITDRIGLHSVLLPLLITLLFIFPVIGVYHVLKRVDWTLRIFCCCCLAEISVDMRHWCFIRERGWEAT